MVPMDSAWNFNSSLARNFGSSGASLSFYSEWKSPKIADFPPWSTRSRSQTSTSDRHLLAPNGLGTSRKLPQGVKGLVGRLHSLILTDFQDL